MAAHKKQDALEVKLEKVGVDLKTCFARLDESDGATEESRKCVCKRCLVYPLLG